MRDDAVRRALVDTPGTYFVTALWLGATLWLGIMLAAIAVESDRSPRAAKPARAVAGPPRFILDAFLVPTIDAEAVPLCWVAFAARMRG